MLEFEIPTGLSGALVRGNVTAGQRSVLARLTNGPPPGVGDRNPLAWLISDVVAAGGKIERRGNPVDYSGVSVGRGGDPKWVDKDSVQLVVDLGGEVRGYPMYMKILEANLDNEVPADWPNRQYEDPDSPDPDNPVIVTHTFRSWSEWATVNDFPLQIGSDWYIALLDWRDGGEPLPASVALATPLAAGEELLSAAEYQARLPTDLP